MPENRTPSDRQAQLLDTCNRLEIPVVTALLILSGRLDEANLDQHPEREKWGIQYRAELAARQEGGEAARQLKHRQAREIAREFKSSLDVAFNILAGQLPPAAVNGKVRQRWVEERRRLEKEKRRENKREKRQRQNLERVTQLWNTCDRLEIPAVGAVLVLSGRLDEANLDHYPERERWRALYQEELAARQEGGESARQLKQRQAGQIAHTVQISLEDALNILAGQMPFKAINDKASQLHNRRRKEWLKTATATLQGLGLPDEMLGNILPNKAVVDPDTSPADVAMSLWLKQLRQSGFTDPRELIAAWQQYRVWTAEDLRLAKKAARERQDREANAGMRGEQVTRLCAPERIEDTMHKLFFLNHWAKARDRLLYDDRQGLYKVKARLLEETYQAGYIRAVTFVDGTAPFAPFLDRDNTWADAAAELFLEVLFDFVAGRRGWDDSDYARALQLFRQALGREAGPEDVDTLDPGDFEDHIHRRLEALQAEAIATRRPIPVGELQALFLSPGDIGALWDGNVSMDTRFSARWEDLDESDLRSLDPEALSLVVFRYESGSARYTFHLPLRVAERFVPAGEIEALRSGSGRTREAGEYFGREITEEESLAQPIRALLEAFGVDIELVCPYNLEDKSAYVEEKRRHAAERYFFNRRGEEWDDEEFLDDEGEW